MAYTVPSEKIEGLAREGLVHSNEYESPVPARPGFRLLGSMVLPEMSSLSSSVIEKVNTEGQEI